MSGRDLLKVRFSFLKPAVMILSLLTLLTGIIYPLCIYRIGQVFFHKMTNGTLFHYGDGKVLGSEWIAQDFTKAEYFHPRPSNAGSNGYDATSSSGSNLGPTPKKLADAIHQRAHDVPPSAVKSYAAPAAAKSTKKSPAIQPYAPPAPWLTGPLIAPIGAIVPYGDFEIEPYLYFTTNTGTYNSHWNSVSAANHFFSLNPQFLCFFGLTPWMDINIIPQFFYNRTAGQSSVNFGDFQAALEFQLLDPAATPYFPGIKFFVKETFPTGPFQRLNPNKLLTDQGGAGTFATTVDLVLYKIYHLSGHHFMSTTYSAGYTITTPVHVHGFNVYGGGFGTDGKVLPGNIFQGIISFEFTLDQNWAFALDNVYTHINATPFYGTAGTNADGSVASVGASSSEQISFAPAIEYSFSATLGIEAGCWFTAWGRNSTEFRSAVIVVAYTY